MGKQKKLRKGLTKEIKRTPLDFSKVNLNVTKAKYVKSLKKINPKLTTPIEKLPKEQQVFLQNLGKPQRSFHGSRISLLWYPHYLHRKKCGNFFGYLSSYRVRRSKLPFNSTNQLLMNQLGQIMGTAGRDTGSDSTIPAGYTYFGQFVDHDITLDTSSRIDASNNANKIANMRTPAFDLDSLYGRGPALDPYLYVMPSTNPTSAIKLKLGQNTPSGIGGPAGNSSMVAQTNFDVPRMPGTNTAIIGDPRNNENLFVSQFHMTMIKFHNKVVDLLVNGFFPGDIFVEAKRMVTHHYQATILEDFLVKICGQTAVTNALTNVNVRINSSFRMPVEFSVAAYRFGHSLVRGRYWINGIFTDEPFMQAFNFIRNPNLPVRSNWVVDFNAFFSTGIPVSVFNNARKIDTVLTDSLSNLPGMSGIMAMLAARNLNRGLAMGLPSGQALANSMGITPLTTAQLTSGVDALESNFLNNNPILLSKTPLWYYILREASVINNGNQLGPLGAKIVADTFVRILKRDGDSILNIPGGFNRLLPSDNPTTFTLADLINFSGVNMP